MFNTIFHPSPYLLTTLLCIWFFYLTYRELTLYKKKIAHTHPLTFWSPSNIITLLRVMGALCIAPLLVAKTAITHNNSAITLLYTLLCATDFVDGWLARSHKQTTAIGALLDPFADKILLCTTMIPMVYDGRVATIVAVLLIARELIVMHTRLYALKRSMVIAVSPLAKVKTSLQFIGLTLLIYHPTSLVGTLFISLTIYGMLGCSMISGAEYVYRAYRNN